MTQRKFITDAPKCLTVNDAAMWVTGWNECLDAQAAQAQAAAETVYGPLTDAALLKLWNYEASSHSHKDRATVANVLLGRGHAVKRDLSKIYRRNV